MKSNICFWVLVLSVRAHVTTEPKVKMACRLTHKVILSNDVSLYGKKNNGNPVITKGCTSRCQHDADRSEVALKCIWSSHRIALDQHLFSLVAVNTQEKPSPTLLLPSTHWSFFPTKETKGSSVRKKFWREGRWRKTKWIGKKCSSFVKEI